MESLSRGDICGKSQVTNKLQIDWTMDNIGHRGENNYSVKTKNYLKASHSS